MESHNQRMRILEMIEDKEISVDEGLHLLQALSRDDGLTSEDWQATWESVEEPDKPADELRVETEVEGEERQISTPAEAERQRHWWRLPFWIGVGILTLGAILMFWALEIYGLSLWFVCAGVPFIIGVLIMGLAWSSRSAPWLHLHVEQKAGEWPQRISLSFPLPVRPAVWFLRTFGHRIPSLEEKSLDEVLTAIGETTSPEDPISIEVNEGEGEERVEITIG